MSESKQDTITVELPIEAKDDGRVSVLDLILSRKYWRKVAVDPTSAVAEPTRVLAPAVVAWIERDEWEPLGVPEVGRKIQATLRGGRVETFEVKYVEAGGGSVVRVNSVDGGLYYIDLVPDHSTRDRNDILAWEYVDETAESEPEATHTVTVSLQADLSGFADSLQAAADAIRETIK